MKVPAFERRHFRLKPTHIGPFPGHILIYTKWHNIVAAALFDVISRIYALIVEFFFGGDKPKSKRCHESTLYLTARGNFGVIEKRMITASQWHQNGLKPLRIRSIRGIILMSFCPIHVNQTKKRFPVILATGLIILHIYFLVIIIILLFRHYYLDIKAGAIIICHFV